MIIRYLLISSLSLLIPLSLRLFLTHDNIFLSDFIRPFFFLFTFAALPLLFSRRKDNSLLFSIQKVLLLIGLVQLVLCFAQYFFPSNSLIYSISRFFFASSERVDMTMVSHNRALGLLGGPAPSGVLAVSAVIASFSLLKTRRIRHSHFLLIHISQLFSCFFMASKASFAFLGIWFAVEALSQIFFRFKDGRLLLGIFSPMLIIASIIFLFAFADVSYMRSSGGILEAISPIFRLSSFYVRLSYHENSIFAGDTLLSILIGSDLVPSPNLLNRVFDSDYLYFSNVYGIAGFLFFLLLIWYSLHFARTTSAPIPVASLFIALMVFNPVFTGTLCSIPIVLSLYPFTLKNKSRSGLPTIR